MFLFRKTPRSCLGIDVGASAIKIVELEKEKQRHRLKNYAIFSLEDSLRARGYNVGSKSFKIANDQIAEIIVSSIREAKMGSKHVYFSVPVCFSFSTLIDLPMMPKEEVAAAVPFEAKKYIPLPMSEVMLDWNIVNSSDDDNLQAKKKRQVLVVAVPKEIINNYNAIAKTAGLQVRAIEGESFSLARSLVGNDKTLILLIDAGARSINLTVVEQGSVRITHNLELGGAKITQIIAQDMNVESERAEEQKKKFSAGQEHDKEFSMKLKGSIYSVLGGIVIEIKKVIDSYQIKYNKRIEKCIIVGGSAHLFEFVDYLKNKLALDVSIGNAFARVIYPPEIESLNRELSFSLAVAVGAAMNC